MTNGFKGGCRDAQTPDFRVVPVGKTVIARMVGHAARIRKRRPLNFRLVARIVSAA
jgi:hypothetical protein